MFGGFAHSVFDSEDMKLEPIAFYGCPNGIDGGLRRISPPPPAGGQLSPLRRRPLPTQLYGPPHPPLHHHLHHHHPQHHHHHHHHHNNTSAEQSPDNGTDSGSAASNDVGCPTPAPSSTPNNVSSRGTLTAGGKQRKPQECKVCGKILSSTSSYYVHMKLHSGNKPFQCTHCDASFCRKPYLEVHLRTHTGERPFRCEVCEKRFTQKSSLNTHKRVHTGLRPYGCDMCDKKFAVKSYLAAHRWSHIAEGMACPAPDCGEVFNNKTLFIQHVRAHNGGGYECALCRKKFVKDSYLIRHQNRVHKNILN